MKFINRKNRQLNFVNIREEMEANEQFGRKVNQDLGMNINLL